MNGPRVAVLAAVLVTALLLDTVVLAPLTIAGVGAEVVTLTVVAVAFQEGAEAGMRYGFAAGLVADLVGGGLVGLSALVLVLLAFALGVVRPYVTATPFFTAVVVSGLGVAGVILLYGGLSLLLDPGGLGPGAVLRSALIAGLLNGLLAPLIVRPVMALCRRTAPLPTV